MAFKTLFKPKPLPEEDQQKAAQMKRESIKKTAEKLANQRTPLPVGTLVERYKIGKLIGMGSFSLVYQAKDTKSKQSVIIKEYYPKYYSKRADDKVTIVPLEGRKLIIYKQGFKQFFSEALALHKINHPNVLKVNNIFRANKTAYMVSNNEVGRDLKWFLATTNEPLQNELIYKIFLPILSSLNKLHKTGYLHLDIKPANILLRANSGPLLVDFGASQAIANQKRADQKRASEKRVNNMQTLTHGFAPPEQYHRKSDLGPWTDIYAVSATLYHAITKRLPAMSKNSMQQSQLNLEEKSALYSSAMLNAINQALVHDYGKRFHSVDGFAKELLTGSRWGTLADYELQVMAYDRHREHPATPTFISA